MLCMMPLVMGDLCEDNIEITSNCTMLTPSMSCTNYVYSIYNLTGQVEVNNESLTQINESLYSFNFTLGKGEYIVFLCDGTTREVHVKSEVDKMGILAAIIFMPLIIAGLMFYLATKFDKPEHWAINWGLLSFGVLMIVLSWGYAILVVAEYLQFEALQNVLGASILGQGMLFWIFIFYVIIQILIISIKFMLGKKKTDKVGNYEA